MDFYEHSRSEEPSQDPQKGAWYLGQRSDNKLPSHVDPTGLNIWEWHICNNGATADHGAGSDIRVDNICVLCSSHLDGLWGTQQRDGRFVRCTFCRVKAGRDCCAMHAGTNDLDPLDFRKCHTRKPDGLASIWCVWLASMESCVPVVEAYSCHWNARALSPLF